MTSIVLQYEIQNEDQNLERVTEQFVSKFDFFIVNVGRVFYILGAAQTLYGLFS